MGVLPNAEPAPRFALPAGSSSGLGAGCPRLSSGSSVHATLTFIYCAISPDPCHSPKRPANRSPS
eukprot:15184633-Alexandrium_andersonii.AAC.1